jgi:hypothetical protein
MGSRQLVTSAMTFTNREVAKTATIKLVMSLVLYRFTCHFIHISLSTYEWICVERWIVCTPLIANVFVTLATQLHLEYHCKPVLKQPEHIDTYMYIHIYIYRGWLTGNCNIMQLHSIYKSIELTKSCRKGLFYFIIFYFPLLNEFKALVWITALLRRMQFFDWNPQPIQLKNSPFRSLQQTLSFAEVCRPQRATQIFIHLSFLLAGLQYSVPWVPALQQLIHVLIFLSEIIFLFYIPSMALLKTIFLSSQFIYNL